MPGDLDDDRLVRQTDPVEGDFAVVIASGALATDEYASDFHAAIMRDVGERTGVRLAKHSTFYSSP